MVVITTEQAKMILCIDKGNQAYQSPFSAETRFFSYEHLGLGIKGNSKPTRFLTSLKFIRLLRVVFSSH